MSNCRRLRLWTISLRHRQDSDTEESPTHAPAKLKKVRMVASYLQTPNANKSPINNTLTKVISKIRTIYSRKTMKTTMTIWIRTKNLTWTVLRRYPAKSNSNIKGTTIWSSRTPMKNKLIRKVRNNQVVPSSRTKLCLQTRT